METFKVRIYVDDLTDKYCKRAFGVRRVIYNKAIDESIKYYEKHGCMPTAYYLATHIRKEIKGRTSEAYGWIQDQRVTSRLIDSTLKQWETAQRKYAHTHKRPGAHLQYKSRKDRIQSITCGCNVSSNFRVENEFKFSFITPHGQPRGSARTRESINFLKDCKICQFTIKCEAGKYYACITFERPNRAGTKHKPTGKIGIDLGIKISACTFDGTEFKEISFNTERSQRLDELSQNADKALSRMTYGSNRYERRLQIKQRRSAKAARIRRENLNELVHFLITNYDVIVIDDFNYKSALKVANRNKAYRAMKHEFLEALQRKAAEAGITVRFVQHQKGQKSSRKCACCGSEHCSIDKQIRQFTCLDCGHTADRDHNAAEVCYKFY